MPNWVELNKELEDKLNLITKEEFENWLKTRNKNMSKQTITTAIIRDGDFYRKVESVYTSPDDVKANDYENKVTRPLRYDELFLILSRFKIMLEEPNKHSIEEFIHQEDLRRKIF